MPIETISVDKWIYNLLNTDATLQALLSGGVPIYNVEVPQATSDPYVVLSMYTSLDANANDGQRIFTMNQYQVVTIGKNNGFLPLQAIADRCDFLMVKTPSISYLSTYIGHFMRESIIQTQNRDEDDTWYNLGGIYRAMAHSLV